MDWANIDWAILDRLRDGFLRGIPGTGPYWRTPADLANYDFTFGERIGWKWDHVLRELRLRGWQPTSRNVFDWGCGSGLAARRTIEFFGAENFDSLTVWDHSPLACDFAATAAQHIFPNLRVMHATPGLMDAPSPLGLVVISHVLNELTPEASVALRAVIARAEAVIWVEPGTHLVSRQLGRWRDEGRATSRIVAPCTHPQPCPIFAAGNERHWCHFFAPPPPGIFADSNWVKFGQRAGIDLRSLPYCFFALDRSTDAPVATAADRRNETGGLDNGGHPSSPPAELSRVIGRPEHFKPYARLLNCDSSGLVELELPKRSDPALFKELERTKAPLVYRWRREGNKILAGESLK